MMRACTHCTSKRDRRWQQAQTQILTWHSAEIMAMESPSTTWKLGVASWVPNMTTSRLAIWTFSVAVHLAFPQLPARLDLPPMAPAASPPGTVTMLRLLLLALEAFVPKQTSPSGSGSTSLRSILPTLTTVLRRRMVIACRRHHSCFRHECACCLTTTLVGHIACAVLSISNCHVLLFLFAWTVLLFVMYYYSLVWARDWCAFFIFSNKCGLSILLKYFINKFF